MLKTISAALFAVSVFAAPAFAGGHGRTTPAPSVRDGHLNSRVFNAYGWGGRDHHHYRHHRHCWWRYGHRHCHWW